MFEAAELGRTIDKESYREAVPALRTALVQAQHRLRKADFPVLLLLAGDDRESVNQVLNELHDWMDAKFLAVHAFDTPTDEEQERPEYWRYWRCLPADGHMGVFVDAWSMRAVVEHVHKRIDDSQLDRATEDISRFETMLADDGFVLLKVWLHRSREEHRRHLEELENGEHVDGETLDGDDWRARDWQLSAFDRWVTEDYDHGIRVAERILRRTSTAEAPWQVVESGDERYRNLTVGRLVLEALTSGLDAQPPENQPPEAPPAPASDEPASDEPASDEPDLLERKEPPTLVLSPLLPSQPTVLSHLDLSQHLSKGKYRRRRDKYQGLLRGASLEARRRGISTILVFEGWDAGGKGGAIRRLTRALHARYYRAIPIGAPDAVELSHHYLWRFWRHLPRAGHTTIFDRSWYGRVLVERVEGYAEEPEWRRAYNEINHFEEQLCNHGILLLKFWLHIDPEEQLRRFREREQVDYKNYKITPDDWRNRERWADYELAADEMIARTSSEFAPWHLVPANDKRFARVEVLKTVAKRLARMVD